MKRLAILAFLVCAAPALAQSEEDLRVADAAQHAAARANDGEALHEMAHPNFRLYAPEGYIGDRDRLLARFRSPETGYVRFERTVDQAVVTGAAGVVMGTEVIARRDESPVMRRFTNFWIWDGVRWLWLARHAHAIEE